MKKKPLKGTFSNSMEATEGVSLWLQNNTRAQY